MPLKPPLDYQIKALKQLIQHIERSYNGKKCSMTISELENILSTITLRDGIDPLFEPLSVGSVQEGLEQLKSEGFIKLDGLTISIVKGEEKKQLEQAGRTVETKQTITQNAMIGEKKKSVFISYSSKDKEFVERIARDLIDYKIDVWLDFLEIKAGESITEKLNAALRDMDYFVIVLSDSSINSNWVKSELSAALMRKFKDQSVTIIPVLKEESKKPQLIADLKYANFTREYSNGMKELLEGLGVESIPEEQIADNRKSLLSSYFHNTMDITDAIRIAGRNRKLIWIEAKEEDGSVEPRKVEPYSFRVKGGNLLFYGWDITKNEIRSFRVDRILKVQILDEDFKPRYTVEF